MDNLKIAARLPNRELSKRPSITCRREKRKKAIMPSVNPGLDPHSLSWGGPILTILLRVCISTESRQECSTAFQVDSQGPFEILQVNSPLWERPPGLPGDLTLLLGICFCLSHEDVSLYQRGVVGSSNLCKPSYGP